MIPEMSCLDGFTPGPESECWPWTGPIGKDGYGIGSAHRRSYRLLVGPIPAGLHLDHLCHTLDLECIGGPDCLHRRCVNPVHLEPVTQSENSRRAGLARSWRPKRPAPTEPPPPPSPAGALVPPWRRSLLPPPEAAEYLGVTEAQLAKWRGQDRGPEYLRLNHTSNTNRGRVRYDPRELDAWLADQLRAAPLSAFAQPDLMAA